MRRRAAKIRKIFPDAKYGEIIVSRFVNRLMNDGKKSVVEKAIYEAFDNLEKKLKKSPIQIFKDALIVPYMHLSRGHDFIMRCSNAL